jgi:hypothetical protein
LRKCVVSQTSSVIHITQSHIRDDNFSPCIRMHTATLTPEPAWRAVDLIDLNR